MTTTTAEHERAAGQQSVVTHPDVPGPEAPTGQDIVHVVLRHWLIVVSITLIATVLGVIRAADAPDEWEARARVLVGPYATDLETLRASSGLAQTYAGLATSDTFLDRAGSAVGVVDIDAEITEISATANDVTRIATIRVVDDDAELAAAVANSIAEQLSAISAGSTLQTGVVTVLDDATAERAINRKQGSLMVALWTFGGFACGLIVAMYRHKTDGRVRDASTAMRITRLPLSGVVRMRLLRRHRASRAGSAVAPLRRSYATSTGARASAGSVIVLLPAGSGRHIRSITRDAAEALTSIGRGVIVVSSPASDGGDASVTSIGELLQSVAAQGESPRLEPGQTEWMEARMTAPLKVAHGDVIRGLSLLVGDTTDLLIELAPIDECPAAPVLLNLADHALIVAQLDRTLRDELGNAATSVPPELGALLVLEDSLLSRIASAVDSARFRRRR